MPKNKSLMFDDENLTDRSNRSVPEVDVATTFRNPPPFPEPFDENANQEDGAFFADKVLLKVLCRRLHQPTTKVKKKRWKRAKPRGPQYQYQVLYRVIGADFEQHRGGGQYREPRFTREFRPAEEQWSAEFIANPIYVDPKKADSSSLHFGVCWVAYRLLHRGGYMHLLNEWYHRQLTRRRRRPVSSKTTTTTDDADDDEEEDKLATIVDVKTFTHFPEQMYLLEILRDELPSMKFTINELAQVRLVTMFDGLVLAVSTTTTTMTTTKNNVT